MNLFKSIKANYKDNNWLPEELFQRAACKYEEAGLTNEAADCWLEANRPERALQLAAHQKVAEKYMLSGNYGEALRCYEEWLKNDLSQDLLSQIKVHLGIAACLELLGRDKQNAKHHYYLSRALFENKVSQESDISASCWEALGDYGYQLNRDDLIHIGYEQALSCYGEMQNEERIRLAKSYIKIFSDNQTLVRKWRVSLEEWAPGGAFEDWEELRDEIENGGFNNNLHNILYFQNKETQLKAWKKLASVDFGLEQGSVNEYLRSLAPPEMILIPAGFFRMGSLENERMAEENEKPQHTVSIPAYYMAKFPVRRREFERFIQSGGYQERSFWTNKGWEEKEKEQWQEPSQWNSEHFNQPEQPVVGICWNEAVAYCNWNGTRLPTEAQWEKAASWDEVNQKKRKYPWGDEWDPNKCDVGRKRIGPASVRSYLTDKSPVGIISMGGGVAEFTSSLVWDQHKKFYTYPYKVDEQRENWEGGNTDLVWLRSASWEDGVDAATYALCTQHDLRKINNRSLCFGFRCVAPQDIY